jgi:hypothetical protein
MSSSKKLTCKSRFICLRTRTPYPPTSHTVYVYTSILIHTEKGGGGRVEPERRVEGQQGKVEITKLG